MMKYTIPAGKMSIKVDTAASVNSTAAYMEPANQNIEHVQKGCASVKGNLRPITVMTSAN